MQMKDAKQCLSSVILLVVMIYFMLYIAKNCTMLVQKFEVIRNSQTVFGEFRGMAMRLKNILIVTKDIDKAKKFYHDLFGLEMILDNDGNIILTEGLVLQDEKIWKDFLKRDIVPENNSSELYFEEADIEAFVEKLERLYPNIQYVNKLMTHSWGQQVVRFYDLDGNLIEVGTPMR